MVHFDYINVSSFLQKEKRSLRDPSPENPSSSFPLLKEMLRSQRHRKDSDDGEGDTLLIDRLGDLPDSILCHILSFLPTKTSLRTSILATRWRFVWKFVPNLHFYRENKDIINRVLFLHALPSINTLKLDLGEDRCSRYQIGTWIIVAVVRNVRNLYISHSFDKKKPLAPLQLFTCETLVYLTLDCCCIIPMANNVSLPRLKKLNLSYVQFEADECLPRLLWGCPVLEYFLLTLQITDRDLVFCNISSPTLKRLEVTLDDDCCPEPYHHEYRLKIDTPALGYLYISDCLSEHFESRMMTSLTEANIRLQCSVEKGDDFVYSHSVLEFVNSLCNVTRLNLDLEYSTKIISSGLGSISFHNLKELILTADGLFLSKFLENADNLEFLTFHEVGWYSVEPYMWHDHVCEGDKAWVEPKQVPTCLSSHLRTVKMFRIDTSSDFEIVRYLLRNARILERIEISFDVAFASKNLWVQEISKIERGSEACRLAFV